MGAIWRRVTVAAMLAIGTLACIDTNALKPTNGDFPCGPSNPTACPVGYVCESTTSTCQRRTFDAASDQPRDATVADTGGEQGSGEQDGGACLMPVAGCTPEGGKLCDPVCQTGCGCHEKCSANVAGVLTCNAPAGANTAKEGQSCNISQEGSLTQTDNCEPGLVCAHLTCSDTCVRICRNDADCPGSRCDGTYAGGLKTCAVPKVGCNPIKLAGPSGCPGQIQGCYLSALVVDETTCDCSTMSLAENTSCTTSRDCFAGLTCVDAAGSGVDLRCHRVCSLTGLANGGCPVGFTCRPLNGSQKYGYCN